MSETLAAPVSTPTAPVAAPAAPAVSTPASAPATRPTSAKAALEAAAAAQETTQPDGTAPPIVAPAEALSPHAKKGPIPFDVHDKALQNARQKARDEALAEHRVKYGWAEQIDQAYLQNLAQVEQRMADPATFAAELLSSLQNHPEHGPKLRSELARILGARRQGPPEPVPDVEVRDAAGNVVGQTYSAARQKERESWLAKQIKASMSQEIQAVKDRLDRQDAEVAAHQRTQQADKQADQLLTEAKVWPGFTDHAAEIATVMRNQPAWTLERAYVDVLQRVIAPTLTDQGYRSALDSLAQKSEAQTVTTGGASSATPAKPKNVRDLAAFMRSMAGSRR